MKKYLVALALFCMAGSISAQEVTPQTQLLLDRNKEFKEEIIKLADNVYTAVGYDVSNITMIVGTDGVILIDGGMIPEITQNVYKEFRKITDKLSRELYLLTDTEIIQKGFLRFLRITHHVYGLQRISELKMISQKLPDLSIHAHTVRAGSNYRRKNVSTMV